MSQGIRLGSRILFDDRPGTVIGDGDGDLAWDILLDDGRETFCRLPDTGGRLKWVEDSK